MDMVIVWALSWWYGLGLKAWAAQLYERLLATYDYFSIGLLAKTLFSPFRQISAGRVNGPIDVKIRAFADNQISRLIGAFVRGLFIVVGIVWLAVQTAIGVILLIGWALLPLSPLIGFIAMITGWVPVWR
jgi:hypothetical protein